MATYESSVQTCGSGLWSLALWAAVLLHLLHAALLHLHLVVIVVIVQHLLHGFLQLLAAIPGHLGARARERTKARRVRCWEQGETRRDKVCVWGWGCR